MFFALALQKQKYRALQWLTLDYIILLAAQLSFIDIYK